MSWNLHDLITYGKGLLTNIWDVNNRANITCEQKNNTKQQK